MYAVVRQTAVGEWDDDVVGIFTSRTEAEAAVHQLETEAEQLIGLDYLEFLSYEIEYVIDDIKELVEIEVQHWPFIVREMGRIHDTN